MKLKIERMGINGEGIGYLNKQPVFVDGALSGEEVDVKIVDRQNRFCRAELVKVLEKSKDRKEKECIYANKCGACSLMHATYEAQLRYKVDGLKQTLIRYAQVNPRIVERIIKSEEPFAYRNSFKLPFAMVDKQLELGMYMPGSNYFIKVDTCMIHEKDLERVKKELLAIFRHYKLEAYDFRKKLGLRTLVVRGFAGKYQVCIVSGEDVLSQAVIEKCMQIEGVNSLWQSVHIQKKSVDIFGKKMIHLGGERVLPFQLKQLKLNLSPKSFFQLNTKQAGKLYDIVDSMVEKPVDFIVEAYSGIGAISLSLQDKAKRIVGIESVSDAVSNANRNASINKIKNAEFICGDAAEKLVQFSKKGNVDVLIVDPPRSGLDDAMIDCILKSKIKKVIYVSCNPATLGKNLSLLNSRYEVKKVVPVDMFSQTAHVESVVLLTNKK